MVYYNYVTTFLIASIYTNTASDILLYPCCKYRLHTKGEVAQ